MAHKLPNGVKTHFFHELEAGKVQIMPKNAEEFQKMLDLVLYDSSAYFFPHCIKEVVVNLQKLKYCYWEQSEWKATDSIIILLVAILTVHGLNGL